MTWVYIKLAVAIIIDVVDFVMRVPLAGTGLDFVYTLAGFLMFGTKGLIAGWEILEVTDQFDGFVPTLTLIALAEFREKRNALKKIGEI